MLFSRGTVLIQITIAQNNANFPELVCILNFLGEVSLQLIIVIVFTITRAITYLK